MSKAEKQMYLADRRLEVMFWSSVIKKGVCVGGKSFDQKC